MPSSLAISRRWTIVALFFAVLAAGSPNVFAWGQTGHEVVALIAERHMSSRTRAAIAGLLAHEGKHSLAEIANWADFIRPLKVPRQPSHVVKIPLSAEGYVPARDCARNDCVLAAIAADLEVLRDEKANAIARLTALKYAVHFVGDIHQPLHAAWIRGFVTFEGKQTTLHKIWDNEIVDAQQMSASDLAAAVDETAIAPGELGTPVDWITESFEIVRGEIAPEAKLIWKKKPRTIPKDYVLRNWPVARDRLEAAGMRLAWLLDSIFDPKD